MSKKRRAAETRGRVAEFVAALWLTLKGYRVLGQRLRTPFGEVDLAAWKNGVLVIVEVKARKTYDAGAYAVQLQAQLRIGRAAEVLAGRWRLNAAPIRFDLIVIGAGLLPKHERAAWMIEPRR
jgi:putative endonuclease